MEEPQHTHDRKYVDIKVRLGFKHDVIYRVMYPKKIYLMRHAHSEAQDCKRKGISRDDDSLLDCHITKFGEFQAKTAWAEDDLPDLVVVSPLTRAIQTALIAFEGFNFDHIIGVYS